MTVSRVIVMDGYSSNGELSAIIADELLECSAGQKVVWEVCGDKIGQKKKSFGGDATGRDGTLRSFGTGT